MKQLLKRKEEAEEARGESQTFLNALCLVDITVVQCECLIKLFKKTKSNLKKQFLKIKTSYLKQPQDYTTLVWYTEKNMSCKQTNNNQTITTKKQLNDGTDCSVLEMVTYVIV